ncbi:MAG: hypothetical protein V4563_14810 [Pseudomonadota bacterium]
MPQDGVRLVDGQFSFTKGNFGDRTRTIVTPFQPDGIPRNAVAWMVNATARSGALTQRTGWNPLVQDAPWNAPLFQGAWMYERPFGDPYIIVALAGELWRIRVDTDNSVENLSALFGAGLTMPPTEPQAYFAQAGIFLIWQAGDLTTNPIFYYDDGSTQFGMRRSAGFIGVNNAGNELPPATSMDFAQQRVWYSLGNRYCAGDIAGNQSSGTAPFNYLDSVLHVTENPVASGGDGFSVPTTAGNIRALRHTSNLDTALGESQMFVFTRKAIYANSAPLTRADWTAATNNNQPLQKVVLTAGGTYAERSIVAVNGDLFFAAPPNGDIRSLTMAIRYFQQWGQVPISRQENRILQFNDRSLLRYASGCYFDNRLLEASRPFTTPVGVACQSILPLDFDLIASVIEREPPAWEGSWQGLGHLQLLAGDFGGRERAFSLVWSESNQNIECWEITNDLRFDNGNRIQSQIEFPSYTFADPTQLKELETVEIEMSKLLGTVEFSMAYRPDFFPCWIPWRSWKVCSAADCTELIDDPCTRTEYPTELFCQSFRSTMVLPKPPVTCIAATGRPSNQGFQFQLRLTWKGYCQINAIRAYALPKDRAPFAQIVC